MDPRNRWVTVNFYRPIKSGTRWMDASAPVSIDSVWHIAGMFLCVHCLIAAVISCVNRVVFFEGGGSLMKRFFIKRACASLAVVLTLIICLTNAFAKRADDIVFLKNGDRLTGEIKKLQRGELEFKASYMAESGQLDWSEVASLTSKDSYLISMVDGQIFTARFELVATGTDNFRIGDRGALRVRQIDVLRILPIEKKFWRQLEGNIDLGLSFTSGNDQYQTELSASVTYRRGDHLLTTAVDSAFSGQTKGTRTARNQFTVDYRKQLSPKWYVGGLFDLLRSDQQSLDWRVTLGGIVGRNLVQSERTRLSAFTGLAMTREKYQVAPAQKWANNADAILGLDFATFRFSKTDIRSRFIVYPSLTTSGRFRSQLNSDLRIKLAKDLWWGLHLYENFDSKPPIEAKKNDLGVSASIGWKF